MSDLSRNAFLRGLGREAFDLLAPHLTRVQLTLGEILYRPEDRIDHIYFPERCLLSVLTTDREGQTVETAMVGVEGALGLMEALGSGRTAMTTLVQVDGFAWRAPASACRALAMSNPDFMSQAWKLTEHQMTESRQSGMCQALHSVEPRLARWLLESLERSGGRNPMPLTQEFIASMLGVQRTTVTAFAAQLQKGGLIAYARGRVELLDAAGLEHRACECRSAIKAERERLELQPPARGLTEG